MATQIRGNARITGALAVAGLVGAAWGCGGMRDAAQLEPLMDGTTVLEAGRFQAEGALEASGTAPASGGLRMRQGVGHEMEVVAGLDGCGEPDCLSASFGGRLHAWTGGGLVPAVRLGGAAASGPDGASWAVDGIAGWDLGFGYGLEGSASVGGPAEEVVESLAIELARTYGNRLEIYVNGARSSDQADVLGAGFVFRPLPRLEVDLGGWQDLGPRGERGVGLVVARRW